MSDSLQLTIVYEQGDDGWVIASIPEVPGAMSQGRTRDEARANVIDALQLILSPEPRHDELTSADREPLTLTIAV
jgi:predicted RNase H-like HicB family nuclease